MTLETFIKTSLIVPLCALSEYPIPSQSSFLDYRRHHQRMREWIRSKGEKRERGATRTRAHELGQTSNMTYIQLIQHFGHEWFLRQEFYQIKASFTFNRFLHTYFNWCDNIF